MKKGILLGIIVVLCIAATFSQRPIELTDVITIHDSDGDSYKVYWSAIETFAEDNIDTFPNAITFTSESIFSNGFATEADITGTEINGDTLGTATGVVFANTVSAMNQLTITFTDYQIPITDSEGAGGHGSLEIIDFPEGMIYILGIVADVSIDSVSGIAANGTFDMALGSTATATDNEVLAGTEVDVVAKVDGTLVGGADTIDLVTNTPQTEDGHTTDTSIYFNISVTDANMTATGWMAIYGTMVITWIDTGDY